MAQVMPEVAKCALCGKEPVAYPYSYSPWAYECCKTKCDDAETWNRVQAALLAEKELAELKDAVTKANNKLLKIHMQGWRMKELKRWIERDFVGQYMLIEFDDSNPAWWWDILAEYFTAE